MSASGGTAPAKAGQACQACRTAKVKCTLTEPGSAGVSDTPPCGRCKRLEVVCTPTPPSRRGRPGQKQGKRRRLAADAPLQAYKAASASAEDIIETSLTAGLDFTQYADRLKIKPLARHGLMWLARSWLGIAVRRRSCALIARVMTLGARVGFTLDELFDAGGHPAGGVMGYLPPLLLTKPIPPEQILGPRMTLAEIPTEMLEATGLCADTGYATESSWSFARHEDRGLLRMYISSAIERDVVTYDELARSYIGNTRPMLSHMFPAEEINKHVHAIGLHMRQHIPGVNPPPTGYRTLLTMREGEPKVVDLTCQLLILTPTSGVFVWHCTPADPRDRPEAICPRTGMLVSDLTELWSTGPGLPHVGIDGNSGDDLLGSLDTIDLDCTELQALMGLD